MWQARKLGKIEVEVIRVGGVEEELLPFCKQAVPSRQWRNRARQLSPA